MLAYEQPTNALGGMKWVALKPPFWAEVPWASGSSLCASDGINQINQSDGLSFVVQKTWAKEKRVWELSS